MSIGKKRLKVTNCCQQTLNVIKISSKYAAFGKVTEGMDVVNRIAETPTDYSDRPLEDQVIKTVTVETFGVDYPEPEKC